MTAPGPVEFAAVGRLPAAGDNVAIAVRTLPAGTDLVLGGATHRLKHTVLEGHRFAVARIEAAEPLLSWGLPFGRATERIEPGDYVCNPSMIEALKVRQLGIVLPERGNFENLPGGFHFDEAKFTPAPAVERVAAPRTFAGYARPAGRGVGTRNYVVILGTSSRTAGLARQLAARLQALARLFPGIDGIVPVAHTEGGGVGEPNNATEVLHALAGFIVHPNVGAVLALDQGGEPVDNARLRAFMAAQGYPLDGVKHRFLSADRGLAAALSEGEAAVRAWLPSVAAERRTPQPLSGLRVALQCGGSDAFSGLSGNPLAGAVVHELIRHGGTGVLTETDELVGSEPYLERNISDLATARALFTRIERFKERLAWHGTTAESNPSGGNKLRGLYNIGLKSLGAAHKKDPRTRIDHVTDYARPLTAPGFYFMDGPGNDLEGIAGQVGAGCNLFIFVTGNGSITNFPFVPTLKVTTTTRRHQLLIHEMDINAGRYLDGEPMEALVADAFEVLLATASGRATQGERAGHSQVSLWRDWRQTSTDRLAALRARPTPDGIPLVPAAASAGVDATERIGLVLPTSMCAAQIARMAADRLNERRRSAAGVTRFVALAHSEGCGFGGDAMYDLLQRTYRGYLAHPNVAAALLLEHGCEKIPNDSMRRQLEKTGESLDRFGWASVQLDGGIQRVLDKVEAWFADRIPTLPAPMPAGPGGARINLGLLSAEGVRPTTAAALAEVARAALAAGGSVFVPEGDALLATATFCRPLLGSLTPRPTLAYGEAARQPGLHVVATETDHWVENCTGLGGCGAQVIVGVVRTHAQQGHPLVAVVQAAEPGGPEARAEADVDTTLTGEAAADAAVLTRLVSEVAAGRLAPAATARGLVDFQLTRGELGVTT